MKQFFKTATVNWRTSSVGYVAIGVCLFMMLQDGSLDIATDDKFWAIMALLGIGPAAARDARVTSEQSGASDA